jgi:hypothetical protein
LPFFFQSLHPLMERLESQSQSPTIHPSLIPFRTVKRGGIFWLRQ